MDPNLPLAFVLVSAVLIVIRGPNVGLIVSNSLRFGTRAGLATVAGTILGIALQLGVVCVGMSRVMLVLAEWFDWVRWLGMACLVYLGLQQLRTRGIESEKENSTVPIGKRSIVPGESSSPSPTRKRCSFSPLSYLSLSTQAFRPAGSRSS